MWLVYVSILTCILSGVSAAHNPINDFARVRRGLRSLASKTLGVAMLGIQSAAAVSPDNNDVHFPLEYLDGVITTNYSLSQDGAAKGVRAIVDTGSPFLIVPTVCTRLWGCPSRQELSALRSSGLEDTVEVFGGQDYDTSWALLNRGVTPLPPPTSTKRGDYPRLLVNDAVVATVGSDIMLPPGGVFFGLIKYKAPYVPFD